MKSRIHSRSCGETTESFDDVSVVKMGKDFLSIFTSRMYVSRYIIRISLADGHFQSCLLNTYTYMYMTYHVCINYVQFIREHVI